MKQNKISFNITFNNIPYSMLTAMNKMNIQISNDKIEIDFNRAENLNLFVELVSLQKVAQIENKIDSMIQNEMESISKISKN